MGVLDGVKKSMAAIIMILLASVVMIVLGLIYFVITLWIVDFGAGLLDLEVSGDYAVLSASIITFAAVAGSSLARRD